MHNTKSEPNVNQEVRVLMMCQYRSINLIYAPSFLGMLIIRKAMYVRERAENIDDIFVLSTQFCSDPKAA